MGGKKITIKDIARLTNVSQTTVSLVMNNKRGVGKETRQRVLSVAKAMNYTPNILARSLVTNRSNSIAFIITTMKNSVFDDIASGIENVMRQRGFLISIMTTNADEVQESNVIDAIGAHGFDGVITAATLLDNQNHQKLSNLGIPVIWLLRRHFDLGDDEEYAIINSVKSGYLAAEHLIRLGHKRIGIINGPDNTSTAIERFEGTINAFKDYNISLSKDLVFQGNYLRESGYNTTLRLLELDPGKRPTAICAGNDDMVLGAFDAIVDKGLSVPEDIALLGAGNVDATTFRMMNISTVSQQNMELGKLSAQRLADKIEKKRGLTKPFHLVLQPELIIRDSCGFSLKKKYLLEKVRRPFYEYADVSPNMIFRLGPRFTET